MVAIELMERMIRMLGHRIEQEFEVDRGGRRGGGGGEGRGDDVKLEHDVALNC